MRVEMPDNNTIVIDDGSLVIAKGQFGEFVVGYGSNMNVNANFSQTEKQPFFDPMYYMNGANGLTVAESVERALNRVYNEIWEQFTATDIGDVNLLRQTITEMIEEGQGRQSVYALAGGIKKGFINGYYEGVPLAWVMRGYIDGHITNGTGSYPQGTPVMNSDQNIEDALTRIFGSGR